ncbi:acyltransferase family protein [Cloacibacterium rupense]|nr:acyltransferase [Cloacibacterium rupense]
MTNDNHLKGLDTLRAIAALIVVWSHIEIIKGIKGLPQNNFIIYPNAHYSVTLFFVLSGFLITFLLVKEFQKYQTISFKDFYVRRILRIWPLYYLILFISYFFAKHEISHRTLMFCLSIFPNIPPALKSSWESSPQIWSIGVEEQFYLFWPIFISYIIKKQTNLYIIIFIIIYTALPFVLNFINIHTIENEKLYSFTEKFFNQTKFNCMAIGAFFGINLAMRKKWLEALYSNFYLSIFFILTSFTVWFGDITFGKITDEVYALVFAFMILSVVKNKKINIDNKVSSTLGKISYGIYMYHWLIILLILKLLMRYKNENYFEIALYISVFGMTIFVSWISYHTYEKYFLQLKKKFETKL